MDEFVDSAYEGMQSKRKLETIDAVAILHEINKKAFRPIGGDTFLPLDSFFPIGLKIYRDIEELSIEGIKPVMVKQIEPFTGEAIPEHTLKRLQSLSFLYEEFYKLIEERVRSTRSVRYRAVSEGVAQSGLDSYERIIFAGFYALTKYEKVLFRKLLEKEKALLIFQDGTGLEEKLKDLGITFESAETGAAAPEIHFYSSPDTHGQVFALNRVIEEKEDKKEFLSEKTTIVLPSSETLFPLLRQVLPIFSEDSYNISLGYPLQRTPIFGFINNLMELITSMDEGRIYIPDYLKFVLHPYTKNIYFKDNAEVTRIMFHAIEEEITKYRTRTFATLTEIEEGKDLLDQVMKKMPAEEKGISKGRIKEHLKTIHRNTIETFLSFENIGDFAGRCTELLTYIYNHSTARMHPLFYPFSESFLRLLDTLSMSEMKTLAFRETGSYFTFFRKYIMTGYTPFEGTPLRGLQVLGFLETRSIKFDTVFVLDSNEETIPDTRKDDTLLPFKARQILGLPTYVDRDKLAAYYFETLLKGAKEVHLFFIENDKKEKSRFVEKLLWEKQKKDKTTDAKKYLRSVQYKVKLDNPAPHEISKTEDILIYLKDLRYSATALDRYLNCQLQFYYSYVLRLDRKEEVSGDIERVDIGKFVHKTISQYFSVRKGRRLRLKDINTEEMDLLIDKLFESEYGKNPSGALYLLKLQIRDHLKGFLERYYLPLIKEEQVTILDVEKDIEISADSFRLKGRLDSIEKRGGKTYIIDYKTGSNPNRLKINLNKLDLGNRDSWNEAIGSLQLPFYIMLYSEKTDMKIKDLNGLFLLLGRTVINKEIELRLFEDGDEKQTFETFKTVILHLLKEIVDPVYPFKPAQDKKASCPECNFKYICGTQWVVK